MFPPAFCNHTRSVCPISVTRLETDLAGVWLISVLIHLKYEKNREDIGLFGI